jgi:multiple sugar transport system substrate-binding protein
LSQALANTKTLSIVQWSHFVPEYDKWFDEFAKSWGGRNGITVTIDHIRAEHSCTRRRRGVGRIGT